MLKTKLWSAVARRQCRHIAYTGFQNNASRADIAVIEALTLLRKNNVQAVSEILVTSKTETVTIESQDVVYRDGSVLSDYCNVFDVGARRMLPSNLLRRSQVLSVMPVVGSGVCHVRTKVCSKSGEEGIILWKLQLDDEDNGWRISCARLEYGLHDVPKTLHPRYSPESILQAYLAAMKNREYTQAQCFCSGIVLDMLKEELSARGYYSRNEPGMLFIEPISKECMDTVMSHDSHQSIVEHREWVWGRGLLCDQKRMVQEVVIKGKHPSSDWQHWIFHIGIHNHHGSWTIHAVTPIVPS